MVTVLKKSEICIAYCINKLQVREKCFSGTNLDIWIGCTGELNDKTGMVINVWDLKKHANKVLDEFDHKCISPESCFTKKEILSHVVQLIWDRLRLLRIENVEFAFLRVSEKDGIIMEKTLDCVKCSYPMYYVKSANKMFREINLIDINLHLKNIVVPMKVYISSASCSDFSSIECLEVQHVYELNFSRFIDLTRDICATLEDERASLLWKIMDNCDLEILPKNDFVYLSISTSFNCAHRLESKFLSTVDNSLLFGKCYNRLPHGHKYEICATLQISHHNLEFEIPRIWKGVMEIGLSLNHSQSLEVPIATGEYLAEYVFNRVTRIPNCLIVRVILKETPNNRFLVGRLVSC